MGDQVEKVILEAEDNVTPITNKANTGLDSFEKKAESSHGKVIRITDQTRTSVQRLIASLEKQAEVYGKSGVDRLIAQRDQLLQRYAKEPAAVDAITRSYEKMIATQKQMDSAGKFDGFAGRVKQFIEHPMEAAKGAITGVLTAMGPMGLAVLAGAAALGSIALAGYEAAKSLGEYGTQVKDVELRTGLTAREVGQFGFAAKAVGQDVSIFERMMRGLSRAADDTSKEGEKARLTMAKMGVTMYDTTGAMKPTSQVLEEISEGLAKMPNSLERDAAAMNIFKRIGVEAIPVIMELHENLAIARAKGYGPSEEEITRMKQYQRELAEVETSWGRFARNIKEPLAATVSVTFKLLTQAGEMLALPGKVLGNLLFGGKLTKTDIEMQETGGWGYGASMDRFAHRREQSAIARNDQMVAAAQASDQEHKQLELAEKKLAELQGELKTGVMPSVNEPTLKEIAKQQGIIAGIKARVEAEKELKEWRHQAAEFEKKGDEEELGTLGKIYYQRDQLLAQAQKVKASEADIAAIRKAADEQASAAGKKIDEAFQKQVEKDTVRPGADNIRLGLVGPSKDQIKEWEEGYKAQEQIEKAILGYREEIVKLTNGPGGELETAKQVLQLRLQAAKTDEERAVAGIDYLKQAASIRHKEAEEAAAEQQEQLDKLVKTSQGLFHTLFTKPKDFGRELANTIHASLLKPVTEGLGNVTANVLHPIIYGADGKGGLSGMMGGLFGGKQADPVKLATDMNTSATMQNSAVMASLTAVLAAAMGVSAPAVASTTGTTGLPGLSMPSISAPAVAGSDPLSGVSHWSNFGPEGWTGGGSPSISNVSGRGGGGFNLNSIFGGGPLPGGTGAASTPPFVGNGTKQAGVGGPGSALGMLKNFKNINWGGFTHSGDEGIPGVDGQPGTDEGASGGSITGVNGMAGAALFTGGSMLAQAGLMGSRRGTWGGVAESTGGGAMIGLEMGGPLGAAIGAAAGFAAGALEKAFGVESPQNEAKRLIKDIYHVSIGNDVANQVVGMAGKYGGKVSLVVRTPEVRQLVELYAASTGQKIPLSATTPHAGSISEVNGRLYQDPSYVYGQSYTYSSSLPTAGGYANLPHFDTGGTVPGAYGTPQLIVAHGGEKITNPAMGGGTMMLQLVVGDKGAADFMTKQYVTAEFVQQQWSRAADDSNGRLSNSAAIQYPGLLIS